MARPLKKGNSYFPFDVSFFADRKIKELRGKYGSDGITLYVYLLCTIYDEGYYLQIDSGFNYVVSCDLGMNDEKIGQILNFLCERSLFNNKLFTSDKVLTSHGIQMRFQEMVRSRAVKTEIEVNEKFWLLDEKETQSYIKCTKNLSYSKKNDSYSEKNYSYSEKNHTKENKIKTKESINIEYGSEEPHTPKKHKYGEYKNVLLSDEDMEKLKTEFPKDYTERIERLSEYIASSGKKYKSHLATIRKWARGENKLSENQKEDSGRYSDIEKLTRMRNGNI